ncbi:hypothetical protein EJ02DRAFT_9418 [Clathrospora elynae]|uniref:Uncharacterized protein n=1 Tax=Clathrospora elynae TaxID=706981 RepID=A0A6A5T5R9_9PLEO|nr:hypothetical protein EJ02DRAFT_9418 [Clathrospora elynae]
MCLGDRRPSGIDISRGQDSGQPWGIIGYHGAPCLTYIPRVQTYLGGGTQTAMGHQVPWLTSIGNNVAAGVSAASRDDSLIE